MSEWRQWLHSRGYWRLNTGAAGAAGGAVHVDEENTNNATENHESATTTVHSNQALYGQSASISKTLAYGLRNQFQRINVTGTSSAAHIMKGMKHGVSSQLLQMGVAGVASLLLLLLLYQMGLLMSGPDAEIRKALHDMAFVNTPTFNCSELLLKGPDKTVVEGQHYHTFPSEARLRNQCQSKFHQHCYRKYTEAEHFPPPKFLKRLREYEAYHEKCTKGHNLTALGVAGDTPPGCKYLVWKSMDGMGNQLLSLACAFVYSLLTNRVMLIATDSHIDSYLCNPFPSSSWILPPDFPEWKLRTGAKRVFSYLDETLASLRRSSPCNTIPPSDLPSFISAAPKHLHALIVCCDNRRDHQFFCPTAQKLFSGANWFFYLSHEYTLPGFYFVPEFREKLNDWFPHHDGFMHVSRYLLNPENSLWARITQFYKANMDGVDRQIGIQPRSWKGDYNPSITRQISRCAVDQNLLPRTLKEKPAISNATEAMGRKVQPNKNRHVNISVLVTSLRAEYRDNLALEYANHLNAGDLTVDVLSASHEGWQKTGDAEHDAKAIMDIWLLSFTHDLVITPFSTFGSTASGLAGIVPLLFINYGQDKVHEPACGRTNAGGPCFIVFPRNQPCDLDPPRSSIFDPDQMVPEVRFCNFNPGIGIVTA